RLSGAVDHNGAGDFRQRGCRLDDLAAPAANVKRDRVRARVGIAVEDGLPESARSVICDGRHRERGRQRAVVQGLEDKPRSLWAGPAGGTRREWLAYRQLHGRGFAGREVDSWEGKVRSIVVQMRPLEPRERGQTLAVPIRPVGSTARPPSNDPSRAV